MWVNKAKVIEEPTRAAGVKNAMVDQKCARGVY